MRPDEDGTRPGQRTLTINLQSAADLSRLPSRALPRPRRGRADRQCREPRRVPGDSPQHWHYAASKAAIVGTTRTIARGYAGGGDSLLRGGARLHRVRDDGGISPGARGGADRRRHPARPRRQAPTRSPRSSAGSRPMRPPRRRAASSTPTAPAMFASLFWRLPARRSCRSSSRWESLSRSKSRSRRSRPTARCSPQVQGLGRLRQARAAGANPRQHLSGRDLRHLLDPHRWERGRHPDRFGHGSGRRPGRGEHSKARLQSDRRQDPAPQPRAFRPCWRNGAAGAADRRTAVRLRQCGRGVQDGKASRGRPTGGDRRPSRRRGSTGSSATARRFGWAI